MLGTSGKKYTFCASYPSYFILIRNYDGQNTACAEHVGKHKDFLLEAIGKIYFIYIQNLIEIHDIDKNWCKNPFFAVLETLKNSKLDTSV